MDPEGQADEVTRRFRSGDSLITIAISGGEEPYFVQKALLCAVSPYFVKALEGSSIESTQHTLTLPQCSDTTTFENFLYWMCYRELPPTFSAPEDGDDDGWYGSSEIQQACIRLWCFADACFVPKLQNEAMRCLLKCARDASLREGAVRVAADLAPRPSLLWNAVVLYVTNEFITVDYDDVLSEIPGLTMDVAHCLRVRLPSGIIETGRSKVEDVMVREG